MYDEVQVLTHSSIRIAGSKRLYFDPFKVQNESRDADIIFVTHDHFDHFSPEDIRKVAKGETILVLPASMKGEESKAGFHTANTVFLAAGQTVEIGGVTAEAVAAYNRLKAFHSKSAGFLGYIVTMDGSRYYVTGDTDDTPECRQVKCDVAVVPVGGTYTMNAKEAAALVNAIRPALAIPSHYGSVVGSEKDADTFLKAIQPPIAARK